MGGTHFLPKIIPPSKAASLFLSGSLVSSSAASLLGLVDELVPSPSPPSPGGCESTCPVLRRSVSVAGSFAASSPVANRGLLRTLRAKSDDGLLEALRREADQQAICYARSDWHEGLNAVAEKREPAFKGFFDK